jgi:flagellar basal-body rod protein FlgF
VSTGIWSAASGATTELLSLDATANNLANANTTGYKADNAVFREHLMSAVQGGHAVKEMRFSAVDGMAHDFSTGPITVTGHPLDVAIQGEGFFAVKTPQGERYTRAGSFTLTQKGDLVGQSGERVLDETGRPITVPPGSTTARITADGTMEIDGATTARLKLVKFPNQNALDKEGAQFFVPNQKSGVAKVSQVTLQPEAVEGANVSVVKGMTSIVTTTRTFDAIQRVLDAFRDADRAAATQVAAVK